MHNGRSLRLEDMPPLTRLGPHRHGGKDDAGAPNSPVSPSQAAAAQQHRAWPTQSTRLIAGHSALPYWVSSRSSRVRLKKPAKPVPLFKKPEFRPASSPLGLGPNAPVTPVLKKPDIEPLLINWGVRA